MRTYSSEKRSSTTELMTILMYLRTCRRRRTAKNLRTCWIEIRKMRISRICDGWWRSLGAVRKESILVVISRGTQGGISGIRHLSLTSVFERPSKLSLSILAGLVRYRLVVVAIGLALLLETLHNIYSLHLRTGRA